jgi:hypothetical protein
MLFYLIDEGEKIISSSREIRLQIWELPPHTT